MEDDKKKKRKNNKKKNKLQAAAKPNESASLHAGASTPDQHQLHVPPIPLEGTAQVSNKPSENKDAREEEEEQQQQAVLGEKIQYLLKEKSEMLQKEAAQEDVIRLLNMDKNESILQETHLKEKIVHLETEKIDLCHKQGSLEQRIEQLQRENHAHLQKEADLDMKIVQLEGEKDSWLQKEAALKKKISHLVDEAAVLNLKWVSLEEKVKQMEQEKDSWILREAALKKKISHLVDEAAVLNLKWVSLEEKVKQMEQEKDSWILREKNSAKESITIQNSENIELRAQVIKLEQSIKSLIEEKQQLEEKISSLELHINDLERTVRFPNPSEVNKETSDDGEASHQIEVARALVEKLIKENSELVEKMNELYVELDQRGKRREDSFSIPALGLPLTVESVDSASLPHHKTAAADSVFYRNAADTTLEVSKGIPTSSSIMSLEDVMMEDRRNNEQHLNDKPANSSEIIEVDEIVQIPLHENEVTGTHLKEAENDLKSDIPLTDAPLIGAPFRLISFVARYVSGADLVK